MRLVVWEWVGKIMLVGVLLKVHNSQKINLAGELGFGDVFKCCGQRWGGSMAMSAESGADI